MTTNYVNNAQYAQPVAPTNDVSGVKITIQQPAAGPNMPAPIYNPYAYPPNYYLMPPVYYAPQQVIQQTPQAQQPIASQSVAQDNNKTDVNVNIETTSKGKKTTKKVTALTDEYIKSLENYLNSSEVENRKAGVTELMERFEEDHSRKNDLALTNLLNKALQDPSPKVKMLACIICESNLAKGNAKTRELLTQISQDKAYCGQLADTAKNGLLALTHDEEIIETDEVKKKKADK